MTAVSTFPTASTLTRNELKVTSTGTAIMASVLHPTRINRLPHSAMWRRCSMKSITLTLWRTRTPQCEDSPHRAQPNHRGLACRKENLPGRNHLPVRNVGRPRSGGRQVNESKKAKIARPEQAPTDYTAYWVVRPGDKAEPSMQMPRCDHRQRGGSPPL